MAQPPLPLPVTAEKSKVFSIFPKLGGPFAKLSERMISSAPGSDDETGGTTQGSRNDNADGKNSSPSPPLEITEADVMEKVNEYRCFRQPETAQDIEVTDLPVFDSIVPYGKDGDVQSQLWAKEVTRLVKAVTTEELLNFQGSPEMAIDSKKSHELLATLSDVVFQALQIVLYDGQCLLAEHVPELCDADRRERSRISLYYLCNRDDEDDNADYDAKISHRHRKDIFTFLDFCTAVFARTICGGVEKKSVAIDILALLAKVTTKLKVVSANLPEFAQTSIDNGAQFSGVGGTSNQAQGEKVHSKRESAREDGGMAKAAQKQQQDKADHDANPGRGGFAGFSSDLGQWDVSKSKKDALRHLYMVQNQHLRDGVLEIFLHLVVNVRGNKKMVRRSLTRYEICAMVYETGFERFRTFVYQDPNTHFSGSAHAYSISCASHAFYILCVVVRRIERDKEAAEPGADTSVQSDTGSDPDQASIGTRITWSYSRERDEAADSGAALKKREPASLLKSHQHAPAKLSLGSMSNVISVLVPLLLANPLTIHHMATVLAAMTMDPFKESEPLTVRPPQRVSAFFCLDTDEYRAAQEACSPGDPRSLSNSLIRRRGLLAGTKVTRIGRVGTLTFPPPEKTWLRRSIGRAPLPTSFLGLAAKQRDAGAELPSPDQLERILKHQKQLDDASSKMREWVLEEKGVMVQCKLYVSVVMLTCSLLVMGGIAVGISVGNRITGVDPFNITTYCWVLAAFVVLVAKSVRVHEWPWNDFLYGRVLCRSVSELSSVTSIHEQLILAYLLQTESTSFLQTRGPFNTVFSRRSDDGFSIDRPLSLWTMLISGLLMIEVDSIYGRGLVCLDLRRGRVLNGVPESIGIQSDTMEHMNAQRRLGCVRLHDQLVNPNTGSVHVRLEQGVLDRYKTIGLYGNDKAVFI